MGRMGLRLLVALGVFICILTGSFTAHAARALLRSPDEPVATTVADAPENRWVMLEDAVLDCSHKRVQQRTMLVLANDRSGSHPFVAHVSGVDCEAASRRPLDGAFIGPFTRVFLRARQNLDLPPGPDLQVFSQFQSPRYLKRALGWRVTWFGLSLLLTALAVWALIAPAPAPSALQEKSGRGDGRD